MKWKAYTISYYEQSCGCNTSRLSYIYDESGNFPREFSSEAEAEDVACQYMLKRGDDNFNTVEVM